MGVVTTKQVAWCLLEYDKTTQMLEQGSKHRAKDNSMTTKHQQQGN
jgi:hypothetical protein